MYNKHITYFAPIDLVLDRRAPFNDNHTSLPTFSIACTMSLRTCLSPFTEMIMVVFVWVEIHGIATCCDVLGSLGVDGAGEDSGCYCIIAGHFIGLLRNILGKAGYDS